jgi:curved DNA-binding protein CbpA
VAAGEGMASMRTLGTGLDRAVQAHALGRDQYLVTKKYSPNAERPQRFFCQFEDMYGKEFRSMVSTSHHSEFQAGDILTILDPRISNNGWMSFHWAQVEVEHIPFPAEPVELDIAYVGQPKRVANVFYYLTKVGEQWVTIPYDVARSYFAPEPARVQQEANAELSGDFYQIIGVSRTASKDDIKREYYVQALKYHPDLNPERVALATECMAKINEAYSVLTDDDERAAYDRMLQPASSRRPISFDEPMAFVAESVKRWPGSGAGVLKALVEKRPSGWIVVEILAFRRHRMVRTEKLGRAHFCEPEGAYPWAAYVLDPIGAQRYVVERDMITDEQWQRAQNHGLYVRFCYVQRAKWDRDRGAPTFKWEFERLEVPREQEVEL